MTNENSELSHVSVKDNSLVAECSYKIFLVRERRSILLLCLYLTAFHPFTRSFEFKKVRAFWDTLYVQ